MTATIAKPATQSPARFSSAEAALAWAEANNVRIRVHMGTVESTRRFSPGTADGHDWGDVYHVSGTVGRTIGAKRSRILLHNVNSHGGMILSDGLVRIRYANRAQGGELYRHPDYVAPPKSDHPNDWAKHFA